MALLSTPILSYGQANPGISGAGQMQQLLMNALKMRGAIQQQKQQQIKNQYLPQQMQSSIALDQERAPYLHAMAQHLMQSMNRPQNYSSPIGKAMQDFQRISAQYGENSPQARLAKQYIDKINTIRGGLSVNSLPGGGFSITQGGLMPNGQQSQNATQLDSQGNIIKSPVSSGTKYSAGGDVLQDATTGNALSVPTKTTVGKLQQGIISSAVLDPSLKKTFSDIGPMIGVRNALPRLVGAFNHARGKNTPAYDRYLSGTQTEVPQISDQLLKNFLLNNTTENRKAMQATITPKANDTVYSYARRIADTLVAIADRNKNYKGFLKKGISLQDLPKDKQSQVFQKISDQITNQLVQTLKSSKKSSATPVSANNNQASNSMVSVISPDGTRGKIPASKLQQALSSGFKRA